VFKICLCFLPSYCIFNWQQNEFMRKQLGGHLAAGEAAYILASFLNIHALIFLSHLPSAFSIKSQIRINIRSI